MTLKTYRKFYLSTKDLGKLRSRLLKSDDHTLVLKTNLVLNLYGTSDSYKKISNEQSNSDTTDLYSTGIANLTDAIWYRPSSPLFKH